MQKQLLIYAIWSLAAWFGVCPTAWTITNEPTTRFDQNIPDQNSIPVVESPLSVLEQQLFADAADGRLDNFTLLDAALIASGVDDRTTLVHYRKSFASWAEELRQSTPSDALPRRQVEIVFEFLHHKILYGKYNIECTDLRQAFDQGCFNCVSATVLFNCLAGELGLSCCGLETPGHASSRVFLPDGPLDVETTCPRWFHFKHDPAKQADALEKTLGRKPASDKTRLHEITPIQLTAMIYYNRGVDFLAEKQFAQAAAVNAKSLRLDPLNNTARGNFLATINNWAIDLGNDEPFCRSCRSAPSRAGFRSALRSLRSEFRACASSMVAAVMQGRPIS